jgi:hypothetical protein
LITLWYLFRTTNRSKVAPFRGSWKIHIRYFIWIKEFIRWFWPYFLDILCFNILNNLLHFWFVALKYKQPYILPLYLCNVYEFYMIHEMVLPYSYLLYAWITHRHHFEKLIFTFWYLCETVERWKFSLTTFCYLNSETHTGETYDSLLENKLHWICSLHDVGIKLLSMKINYLALLMCVILV